MGTSYLESELNRCVCALKCEKGRATQPPKPETVTRKKKNMGKVHKRFFFGKTKNLIFNEIGFVLRNWIRILIVTVVPHDVTR